MFFYCFNLAVNAVCSNWRPIGWAGAEPPRFAHRWASGSNGPQCRWCDECPTERSAWRTRYTENTSRTWYSSRGSSPSCSRWHSFQHGSLKLESLNVKFIIALWKFLCMLSYSNRSRIPFLWRTRAESI